MKKALIGIGIAACMQAGGFAQGPLSDESMEGSIQTTVTLPTFTARLSMGFNYDLLRSPTDVSFDYSKGYIGFNIPFEQTVNPLQVAEGFGASVNSVFEDTAMFTNGEEFQPQTGAKQNANTTIRIDVPMLGGVGTFSHIQNFFMKYSNTLGNADLLVDPDSLGQGIDLLLRGAVNMPVDVTLGWETTTFGYVYRVNKNLLLGAQLHRHIFRMDLLGKVDVDILGYFSIQNEVLNDKREIDYNSKKVKGYAFGHYEAEAWSPAFGVEFWRFSLASRFGLSTKAYGTFEAKYAVPFFIDPKTGQPTIDFNDPDKLMEELMKSEVRDALLNSESDSISYYSDKTADWELPQGHTLGFDIVRNHLSISYTKLFGEIAMHHKNPGKADSADTRNTKADYADLDFGIKVDHVICLSTTLWGATCNAGVFTLDFRVNEDDRLLGKQWEKNESMKMAMLDGSPMFPLLNFSSVIGAKTQLALEIDVLPLPAVKTGFVYHF
jgi:hypothetical protein